MCPGLRPRPARAGDGRSAERASHRHPTPTCAGHHHPEDAGRAERRTDIRRASGTTADHHRSTQQYRCLPPPKAPTTVTGIGYDSESRRLELQLDTGLILAYRNVGPDVHRALLVRAGAIDAPDWQRAQTYWTPETGAFPPRVPVPEPRRSGQRRTAPDSAGAAPICGQFTGGEHICRGRPDIASPWQLPAVIRDGDAQTLTVDVTLTGGGTHGGPELPAPPGRRRACRRAAPCGLLEVRVRAVVPNDVNNSGLDNMSDLYKAKTVRLAAGFPCRRTGLGRPNRSALRLQPLPRPPGLPAPAGGRRRHAGRALSEQLPGRRDRWSTRLSAVVPHQLEPVPADLSTFRYSDDPALFAQDVNAALSRDADAVVPFHDGSDGPVMYGFGSGRKFGVELEYTLHSYPSAWGDEPVDEHLGEAGWEEQETDEFLRLPEWELVHRRLPVLGWPVLLFDVLLDDAQRCSADRPSEVGP